MQERKTKKLHFGPGIAAVLIVLAFGAGVFFGSWRVRSLGSEVTVLAASGPVRTAVTEQAAVDINSADTDLLQTLPGIGPALAERIVAYREEHGPFRYAYEITNVSGVGSGTYEKLRDRITVGP